MTRFEVVTRICYITAGMATNGQLSFADLEAPWPSPSRSAPAADPGPRRDARCSRLRQIEPRWRRSRPHWPTPAPPPTTGRRSSSSPSCLGQLGVARAAPLGPRREPHRSARRATTGCAGSRPRGAARARSSPTGSRSTTCSTGRSRHGRRRVRGSDDRRLPRRLPAARPARRRRPTTGASCSSAASSAGSAGATALPDPFLDLEPPPKPRQERDWLTRDEFRRLLDAAGHPERNLPGLAERDRLALLALVTTGLRRSELCALDWRDLELDGAAPSLLVRCGKGGKPRRQPLAGRTRRASFGSSATARSPRRRDRSSAGSRADGCSRRSSPRSSAAPRRALALEKHVTAHTLRHTAATWLRQEIGDTRLVAEYLGHADLSTVSRYAHVARDELFAAAGRLEHSGDQRRDPLRELLSELRSDGVVPQPGRTQDVQQLRRDRLGRNLRKLHAAISAVTASGRVTAS